MAPTYVYRLFEWHAKSNRSASAVVGADDCLTYGELDSRANGVARALLARGVVPNDLVGIWIDPSADYIVALLGVLKAGGGAVPADAQQPHSRLVSVLQTAPPRLILASAAHVEKARQALREANRDADVLDVRTPPPEASCPGVRDDPDNTAYVMLTSGSTGKPKAIAGRHVGLAHFIDWEIREFGLNAQSRISLIAPPQFDVSLRDIFAPLCCGGTLCIPAAKIRWSPRAFVNWIEEQGITHMHCVPSLFRVLLHEIAERPQPVLPALRRVLLAGEPLYYEDVRRWRRHAGDRAELVNLYGPTETTLAKVFHRIPKDVDECEGMVPLGHPIDGAEILILHDGAACEEGETGEIHVRTAFRTKGYLGNEELNRRAFIPNPLTGDADDIVFKSGDLGRLRPDGTIDFAGRVDNQVKVRGVRIELGDIESNLRRYPQVRDAAAAVHKDTDGENVLAVYVVAREALSPAQLRSHMSQRLPANMMPSYFMQVDALPVGTHGKVDRKALPIPAALAPEAPEPVDQTVSMLMDLWKQVLGVESVKPTDAFQDLGGDEIKAAKLIKEVYGTFDVELTLGTLYKKKRLYELAQYIADESA